ncbi:hypothetical protein LguiB_019037 [Lonicera macranthoides]
MSVFSTPLNYLGDSIAFLEFSWWTYIDVAKDWPCKSGRIPKTLRFDPSTSQTSGLFMAKVGEWLSGKDGQMEDEKWLVVERRIVKKWNYGRVKEIGMK